MEQDTPDQTDSVVSPKRSWDYRASSIGELPVGKEESPYWQPPTATEENETEGKLPKAPVGQVLEEQAYQAKWIELIQQTVDQFRNSAAEHWTAEEQSQFDREWPMLVAMLRALATQGSYTRSRPSQAPAPTGWPPEEQVYHDKWNTALGQFVDKRFEVDADWARMVAVVRALESQQNIYRDDGKEYEVNPWGDEDYSDDELPKECAEWDELGYVSARLPQEAIRIMQAWKPIFILRFYSRAVSRIHDSFFNKRSALNYPEEGTERISDQWNFEVGGLVDGRTDTPVPEWHWAHAVYEGGEQRIWKVRQVWPPNIHQQEQSLKSLLSTLRRMGINFDEILRIRASWKQSLGGLAT